MPVIGATWAHGNAVVAEHPAGGGLQDVESRNYTAVVGYRRGWGAIYEGTGDLGIRDTYFHIPIPTITNLALPGVPLPSGSQLFLDSFHILFEARNCSIPSVSAYDSQHHIWTAPFPNLDADGRLTGNWGTFMQIAENSRREILSNAFTPRLRTGLRHQMLFGLGISVLVEFNPGGIITFFGAGAGWANTPSD